MHALTALWSVCADVEAQLQDIASLCGRVSILTLSGFSL